MQKEKWLKGPKRKVLSCCTPQCHGPTFNNVIEGATQSSFENIIELEAGHLICKVNVDHRQTRMFLAGPVHQELQCRCLARLRWGLD